MGIPLGNERAAARVKLHKAHAALDQPPGQETAGAEIGRALVIQAIRILGGFRLPG